MATVQRLNDSGSWVDVTDYGKWVVEHGTSPVVVVPSATLRAVDPEVSIDANDRIRIQDSGGSAFFEGKAATAGKYDQFGKRDIPVDGIGTELFSERVTFSDVSVENTSVVLSTALNSTENGGDWSINYVPDSTPLSGSNDYAADNRELKAIFRDMMDRAGTVWWVDTVNLTIHVNTLGGRGSFGAVETGTDDVAVKEWDEGNVETVRNDITVYGTGDVQVQGSAEFSSSIGDYGRRSAEYNFDYITDASEANSMASDLLQPFPLESGTLLFGDSVGDITQNLSNYTLDVTDDARGILTTDIAVEKATLREGRAELELGEGAGVSLENLNRKSKSRGDTTEPGSVMDTDRIADLAITAAKIVDGVIDAASDIIEDGAILNAKIADHEVSGGGITGTKMADGFLDNLGRMLGFDQVWPAGDNPIGLTDPTPNDSDDTLVAEFEERSNDTEIDNNTCRLEYDPGTDVFTFKAFGTTQLNLGDGVNPIEILQANSLNPVSSTAHIGNSANEWDNAWIETIAPTEDDTGQVGFPGNEGAYSQMYAYEFIDASDGSTLGSDGGSVTHNLATATGIPDHCCPDGDTPGVCINDLSKWLFEVCREQQQRLESLEDRVESLEQAKD